MQTSQFSVENSPRFDRGSRLAVGRGFSTLWVIMAVAVILLVAILAFGVFDSGGLKKTVDVPDVFKDQQVEVLEKLSPSDEITDIEKDASETNLETIDIELNEVEKEVEAL